MALANTKRVVDVVPAAHAYWAANVYGRCVHEQDITTQTTAIGLEKH